MGNVCCQTDIEPNPFEKETIKVEDYEPAEKPQDDDILTKWFEENQIKPVEGQEVPSQFMKHKYQNLFYFGNWKNTTSDGRGFIYQPNHLFYDGQFSNGLPDGKSIIRFLDKKCEFQGQIREGKAHGEGTIDNLEQKFRFKGVWANSKPKTGILTLFNDPNISTVDFQDFSAGKGVISYKDGRKYVGQIDASRIKPHGKGSVSFPVHSAKISYDGQWDDGQMHGKGKLIWTDGSFYDGQYVRGKKEGEGKFMFASKNYYEGFWSNGKQEGVGILFDKDGFVLKKGLWSQGTFKNPISEEQWESQKKKCIKNTKQQQEANQEKIQSEISNHKNQKLNNGNQQIMIKSAKKDPIAHQEKLEQHNSKQLNKQALNYHDLTHNNDINKSALNQSHVIAHGQQGSKSALGKLEEPSNKQISNLASSQAKFAKQHQDLNEGVEKVAEAHEHLGLESNSKSNRNESVVKQVVQNNSALKNVQEPKIPDPSNH